MKKCVILLSGGMDSATTLSIAQDQEFEIYALTLKYGQRHEHELEVAAKLAEHYEVVEHKILEVDLASIVTSSLTDATKPLPENRPEDEINKVIPETYVPARNLIFLGLALAWAESIEAKAVFIGANSLDYSGYPDCRPEFYTAFQQVADLGTKRGLEGQAVEIRYPLINMTKAQIIKTGNELGVPFELTWSCYDGVDGKACGKCDSCKLRQKGFKEAGIEDPIEYQ
jgi:7-cyano-7-deazaguanine synthase